jgi:hypothetical protein
MIEEQMTSLLEPASPGHRLAEASVWSRFTWPAAVSWAAQVIVAIILAQTLFFKFTYAPETQQIFEGRGGRPAATAVGLIELACVFLLLIPRTSAAGALLSLIVIGGAIFTHLFSLGIEIVDPATGRGDGGLLFGLAVGVACGSIVILALRWRQLPGIASLWPSVP